MPARRWSNRVLVGLFALALGAGAFATLRNAVADEAGRSRLYLGSRRHVPLFLERYFNDHVPAQAAMISAHNRSRIAMFHASPVPRVWIGADDSLYYNHSEDSDYFKPTDPEIDRRIEELRSVLSRRRRELAERGTRLLVVIPPNKQSARPDALPAYAKQPSPTTLDRFLAACAADPELRVLDLRPALAGEGDWYLRSDSHWNQEGMFRGYAAIVGALAEWYPSMIARPRERFAATPYECPYCDLGNALGVPSRRREWSTRLSPMAPRARLTGDAVKTSGTTLSHVPTSVHVMDDAAAPRAVMLIDSFGDGTGPWLAEHFSRLVQVGSWQWQTELIERERPDVVILEFVERYLESREPVE